MEMIKEEEDFHVDMTPAHSNNQAVGESMTEYQSAKSVLNDLDEIEIQIKTQKIDEMDYRRRDSLGEEMGLGYDLDQEYEKMKRLIENEDWEGVKDLDRRILNMERDKRRREISSRLDILQRLESNLDHEMRRSLMDEEKIEKTKELYLVNINEGEGYSILNEDEVNDLLVEQTFCGYVFYTKK
jgi:hypothetical protein